MIRIYNLLLLWMLIFHVKRFCLTVFMVQLTHTDVFSNLKGISCRNYKPLFFISSSICFPFNYNIPLLLTITFPYIALVLTAIPYMPKNFNQSISINFIAHQNHLHVYTRPHFLM